MRKNFTNGDFEDFLKTNSDRFQMRPSEKVWRAISDDLNKKRRRIGLFTTFFLVAVSGIAWYFSLNPATKPVPGSGEGIASQNVQVDNNAEKAAVNAGNQTVQSNIETNQTEANPLTTLSVASVNLKPEITKVTDENFAIEPFKVAYKNATGAAHKTVTEKNSGVVENTLITSANNVNAVTTSEVTALEKAEVTAFEKTIVDSDPDAQPVAFEQPKTDVAVTLPQTIESVTNMFKASQKRSKLDFELFFTPTISYRKLTENKSYLQREQQQNTAGSNPGFDVLYNINDAVTHKPNVGLELGFAAKYPVTENIRLKAGLQFNMSRYDIKAFTSHTEAATMAFRDGNTTTSASNKRNMGGSNPDWLHNIYYQVSAPVGLEVKIGRSDKTQFGIASTVQPTYMIGDRAYLISTDYKNYVEVPWLVRRWNVNTALETFVSYSTGRMNWQVGPQVRYQLLSSFISNYPVKENLFDFGLKIGLSLNKDSGSSDTKE